MRARHALKAHACRADAAEAEAAKRATPIHARRAGPLPSPATIMRAAPLVTMHHDVRRRKRTHSVPRLPAFPPSRLPAFPPSSLPAFQDDRRAPPLFFRHAPSRSASRMSPRLGAIAHDPPVARDSIRAADAGRAASPEPRSRAAPRKTGQRNAPPVAPPTCRHAALPPLPPLPPPGETARPHSASDAAAYALGHRRSIGTPSALRRRARRQRTLNAERARSRRPARRAANARAIAPPASREPSSRLAAQCLQSLDHAEQRAAVLFGAVPRLDDRLAQQIVVRRRQPGRLPRLDAIETA